MNHESLSVSEQTLVRDVNADTEIELLARETETPREIVAKVYTSVRTNLERTARIKTYVPVLIHRQVKALLRKDQCA